MNEFEKAKEAYEQIPIPEELEERVQAGIRQGREARRSAKRQRSWKRSVGAVAACFVVMVGMLNVSPTVDVYKRQPTSFATPSRPMDCRMR